MKRAVPRQALRHTILYLIFGVVWIIGTDGLLFFWIDEPERLTRMQTLKGWLFVFVTAFLFYILISRALRTVESLQQHLRRTERLDAMGKMAGGIAHDFANILAVMGSYVDRLSDVALDNEPRRLVEELGKTVERGNQLTNKLRGLSLNSSANLESADLNEVIRGAAQMLKQSVSPVLTLSFELDDKPCPVVIDVSEFEHSLVNLSINARHATEGGGKLLIRTHHAQSGGGKGLLPALKEGSYVVVSVEDNGHGMQETVKDQMFDPFFTTKGDEGTGLGLPQVYQFVKQCDGDVHVTSRVGQGTTISLFIPLASD